MVLGIESGLVKAAICKVNTLYPVLSLLYSVKDFNLGAKIDSNTDVFLIPIEFTAVCVLFLLLICGHIWRCSELAYSWLCFENTPVGARGTVSGPGVELELGHAKQVS